VKYIWNNSFSNCGCRWKRRMLIAVIFFFFFYRDEHSSLSSTTAVQIWIISYILHIKSFLTVESRLRCVEKNKQETREPTILVRLGRYDHSRGEGRIRRHVRVTYQTREKVFYRDIQTPRRELKIRRVAVYFWRNSRCLGSRWNTVSSVWYMFSIETKTKK